MSTLPPFFESELSLLSKETKRNLASNFIPFHSDPRSEQVQGHHQDKDDRLDVHGSVRDNRVGRVRGRAPMGPPVHPRRIRPRAEEGVVEHQRAEFQPLRAQDGHQPRPGHGGGDRGEEAALRHMGKHRERGVQDGEHRQGGLHPGKEYSFPKLWKNDKIKNRESR